MGWSESFLCLVGLGKKGISVDNPALICQALQVSLSEFFVYMEPGQCPKDVLAEDLPHNILPPDTGVQKLF